MLAAVVMLFLAAAIGTGVIRANQDDAVLLPSSASDATSASTPGRPGVKTAAHSEPFPCAVVDWRYVNCSGRGLLFLPTGLPENITGLDLSNNSVSEIPAQAFVKFRALEWLNLSRNAISVLNDTAFEGLETLRVLHLRQNKLNVSSLTPGVFQPLEASLKELTLNGNLENGSKSLSYPDRAFSVLRSLETLALDAVGVLSLGSGFASLSNLSTLSFCGYHGTCSIPTVPNDTFINVDRLRVLELIQCDVTSIEPLAFQPLRQLDTLDLSNNRGLGFKGMTVASYGLQQTQIRVLKLNYINARFATCVKIMKCHFHFLQNTSIEEIQIDGNNIEIVEKGALRYVPKTLKTVSARFNLFTYGPYLNDFGELENLVSLDLSQTQREHSLPTVDEDENENSTWCDPCPDLSSLPGNLVPVRQIGNNLEVSGLEDEVIKPFSIPLPPKLQKVNLKWNVLYYHISEVNMSTNSLEELDISFNLFTRWLGPVYGLQNLKKLVISNNLAVWVEKDFFRNFTSLEFLDIAYNRLPGVLAEKGVKKFFEYLKALKVLNVSNNELYSINRTALHGLDSLEVFNASRNRLVVERLLFDMSHLRNLTMMDLSRNNLNLLPPELCDTMDEHVKRGGPNFQLDLSYNPIVCSCKPGNLRFLTWLNTTKVTFVNRDHYFCLFADGTTGKLWESIEPLKRSCTNYIGLALGTFAATFVTLGVVVGLIIYRLRWKLRYLYYTAQGFRKPSDYERLETFESDAFIMHDDEDEGFVREMVDKIEGDGLRLLATFHLDATRPFLKSLVEAIQTSRRTVCIVSKSFFDSPLLDYGLQMAIQESLYTKRDVVLMVLYDPVRARSLSRQVLYYIQSGAFVEYPQDDRCLPFFWDNLTQALKKTRRSRSSASSSSSTPSTPLLTRRP